jgi:beta-lactamase regulating signal transducer with metallopeptidase domain
MMDWLLDTLVWTAALIAVVLLIRRPVARYFGANAAYALWALPLLRLALPPLTLPAWMAPEVPTVETPTSMPILFSVESSAPAISTPAAAVEPAFPFSLVEVGLAVWLAGAAIFLIVRFHAYFQMRRRMLGNARDVGRAGKVRLIETSLTSAPLAFGVIDKVVALPEGFLARWDRQARDLALEHELAHHKGHDLLINFLVQPLFALHWFNPLSYIGWLALRRDQEAACDARVIAGREAEQRATYAKVIASFAAGPNVALAAPMACPVLGDKSIIHRLRSLKMNQQSRQRRLVGRGLLAAALVALPLTATVTYADNHGFDEAFAQTPPAPPAPAAPPAPGEAVPAPPAPPAPPMAMQAAAPADEDVDVVVEKREGDRHVMVFREVEEDVEHPKGKREISRVRMVTTSGDGEKLSEDEKRTIVLELRESLNDADRAIDEAMRSQAEALKEMKGIEGTFTVTEINCEKGGKGQKLSRDDKEMTVICTSDVMANALTGLKEARKAIASNPEMPDDILKEVLKALDEKIAQWENRS